MKFSEIINVNQINVQKAYFLGLVYSWPILSYDKKYLLGYSAYRLGDRSEKSAKYSLEQYFEIHISKLKKFLGNDYEVELNSKLKNKFSFTERLQSGVSILVEFDIENRLAIDFDIFLYGLIEKWLIDIDEKYKKVFLSGVMDGRGSLDFTGNFLSIDIAKKERPDLVKRKLNKYNDIIGAVFNYNPRLTQEKSSKKNDQFRLPLNYYMGNFGIFNPFKIDYYKNERGISNDYLYFDSFLIDKNFENLGLDSRFISDRNLKINEIAIKLKQDNITEEEKIKIIDDYKIKNMISDTDDEILYSSQNTKELAKKQVGFQCEFDSAHVSFTAKSINKNYVEAHHLIPFSERKNFDLNIDILENIVCLCPNCHRKIHLAVDEEKMELIKPIFQRKKGNLQKVGINITEQKLLEFYKIF